MIKILLIDSNKERAIRYIDFLKSTQFHYEFLGLNQRNISGKIKTQDAFVIIFSDKYVKKTLELINNLKEQYPETPHIIINQNKNPKYIGQLLKTIPAFYFEGEMIQENLIANMKLALKRSRPIHELKQLKDLSHIYVKKLNRYTRISINDIVWIKPCGNYTELYISGEKFRYRKAFSTIIEQLPQHLFIRIHKSHVVNVKHVKYISRKFVCIQEELYPIGDAYRKKLMNRLPILHT